MQRSASGTTKLSCVIDQISTANPIQPRELAKLYKYIEGQNLTYEFAALLNKCVSEQHDVTFII